MGERKAFHFGKVSAIVGSAPCYGCTERAAGCHSNCEQYKEYKQLHNAVRENVVIESLGNPGVPEIRKKARDRYAMLKARGRGR